MTIASTIYIVTILVISSSFKLFSLRVILFFFCFIIKSIRINPYLIIICIFPCSKIMRISFPITMGKHDVAKAFL